MLISMIQSFSSVIIVAVAFRAATSGRLNSNISIDEGARINAHMEMNETLVTPPMKVESKPKYSMGRRVNGQQVREAWVNEPTNPQMVLPPPPAPRLIRSGSSGVGQQLSRAASALVPPVLSRSRSDLGNQRSRNASVAAHSGPASARGSAESSMWQRGIKTLTKVSGAAAAAKAASKLSSAVLDKLAPAAQIHFVTGSPEKSGDWIRPLIAMAMEEIQVQERQRGEKRPGYARDDWPPRKFQVVEDNGKGAFIFVNPAGEWKTETFGKDPAFLKLSDDTGAIRPSPEFTTMKERLLTRFGDGTRSLDTKPEEIDNLFLDQFVYFASHNSAAETGQVGSKWSTDALAHCIKIGGRVIELDIEAGGGPSMATGMMSKAYEWMKSSVTTIWKEYGGPPVHHGDGSLTSIVTFRDACQRIMKEYHKVILSAIRKGKPKPPPLIVTLDGHFSDVLNKLDPNKDPSQDELQKAHELDRIMVGIVLDVFGLAFEGSTWNLQWQQKSVKLGELNATGRLRMGDAVGEKGRSTPKLLIPNVEDTTKKAIFKDPYFVDDPQVNKEGSKKRLVDRPFGEMIRRHRLTMGEARGCIIIRDKTAGTMLKSLALFQNEKAIKGYFQDGHYESAYLRMQLVAQGGPAVATMIQGEEIQAARLDVELKQQIDAKNNALMLQIKNAARGMARKNPKTHDVVTTRDIMDPLREGRPLPKPPFSPVAYTKPHPEIFLSASISEYELLEQVGKLPTFASEGATPRSSQAQANRLAEVEEEALEGQLRRMNGRMLTDQGLSLRTYPSFISGRSAIHGTSFNFPLAYYLEFLAIGTQFPALNMQKNGVVLWFFMWLFLIHCPTNPYDYGMFPRTWWPTLNNVDRLMSLTRLRVMVVWPNEVESMGMKVFHYQKDLRFPRSLGENEFSMSKGGYIALKLEPASMESILFFVARHRGQIFHCMLPVYRLNFETETGALQSRLPMLSQDGKFMLPEELSPTIVMLAGNGP